MWYKNKLPLPTVFVHNRLSGKENELVAQFNQMLAYKAKALCVCAREKEKPFPLILFPASESGSYKLTFPINMRCYMTESRLWFAHIHREKI